MQRYALVSIDRDSRRTVERYLPDNYKVIGEVSANPVDNYADERYNVQCVVIQGEDVAGWTLDSYVIPRLRSGLIAAREIDLSHPCMKTI
jgi:hypothetical protein